MKMSTDWKLRSRPTGMAWRTAGPGSDTPTTLKNSLSSRLSIKIRRCTVHWPTRSGKNTKTRATVKVSHSNKRFFQAVKMWIRASVVMQALLTHILRSLSSSTMWLKSTINLNLVRTLMKQTSTSVSWLCDTSLSRKRHSWFRRGFVSLETCRAIRWDPIFLKCNEMKFSQSVKLHSRKHTERLI